MLHAYAILEIKASTKSVLRKDSTTELYPQPPFCFLSQGLEKSAILISNSLCNLSKM